MRDEARMAAGGWAPPASAAGRPLLLVAFGTAHTRRTDVYRAVVEAFADGDWHVVLAIGPHVDPATLHPLPDGSRCMRPCRSWPCSRTPAAS